MRQVVYLLTDGMQTLTDGDKDAIQAPALLGTHRTDESARVARDTRNPNM